MANDKINLGRIGENIACGFLKRSGYKIIETNYQKKIGEIDIIATKNEALHFVEVKTRTLESAEIYGTPQEAVSFQKKRKIKNTARCYLAEKKYTDEICWQIDVVAITVDAARNKAKLNFIENAVENNL